MLAFLRKQKDNNQESIQSSTTPDSGHHMERNTHLIKHNAQESQAVSLFPTGNYKTARSKQGSITK